MGLFDIFKKKTEGKVSESTKKKLTAIDNDIDDIIPSASQNPWNANSLEWTTPVEHVHGNWVGEIPTVYRWPYDYSKPGKDKDFVPQNIPLDDNEEEH